VCVVCVCVGVRACVRVCVFVFFFVCVCEVSEILDIYVFVNEWGLRVCECIQI
jgi:hypothetical protein